MSDTTIVYLIIAAAVVLFVSNRLPVELVAIGVALSLYFTDIVSLEQAFAGFGDPTVVFIAALFVVSEALDATGATAWAGQQLVARSANNRTRLMLFMMLLVAVLSALITPNGAVAALVPVVVVLAVRLGRPPSEMLLPLAFASFAGSLLVLTGSPVSVIASETSKDAGAGAFNYLEFAIVGVPLLVGTIVIALLFGKRLIPARRPRSMPPDFSAHARSLLAQYGGRGAVYRLRVPPGSSLIGMTHEALDLQAYPGLSVVSAQEHGRPGPVRRPALTEGDVLVMRGERAMAEKFAADHQLEMSFVGELDATRMFTVESGLAEIVVPPRSGLIGETVFPGMVTESGDLVVLAVQRSGEDRPGKTALEPGDTLLLQGQWDALGENLGDSNVLVVDAADQLRRQLSPLGVRSWIALAVLAGMVLLLVTGAVPAPVAALLAAAAIIALRVLSVQQAYRGISWTVVILIGGMIPLSTAMTETGAANQIADRIVDAVGGSSGYVLLLALFLVVAAMGQLISSTATALIVFPVAVAAALELDVSVQAVLMSVNIAAHASFLTPIATTPNLMVLEPGGYRFSDYWPLGIVMMAWYLIIGVLLVPLVWSL